MIVSIRRALVTGATLLALAAAPTAAANVADETALAERYAPVVRLVEQAQECDYGESYEPIHFDTRVQEELAPEHEPGELPAEIQLSV